VRKIAAFKLYPGVLHVGYDVFIYMVNSESFFRDMTRVIITNRESHVLLLPYRQCFNVCTTPGCIYLSLRRKDKSGILCNKNAFSIYLDIESNILVS